MSIRSFIALELNDEVRAKLADLLTALRQKNAVVKWVEPENLHLTLKFLGEVPEGQIAKVKTALQWVAQSLAAFEFRVKGTGGFPDLRRPRVLWVGVDAIPPLMQLQGLVETAMEQLGFAPEGRAYHPHITIGRVKAPTNINKVAAVMNQHKDTVFGTVSATHLTLFRSDLSREGPNYTPLVQLPFGQK